MPGPFLLYFDFDSAKVTAEGRKIVASAAAAVAAAKPAAARPMKKDGLLVLIDSLRGTVKKLEWKPAGTEWGDYYDRTNYSDKAFEHKRQVIAGWIEQIQPARVWDLGANNGQFSRIASQAGHFTASFDIDPAAVEQNYRQMKQSKEANLLPLLQDLTNPSAGIGWANRERDSLAQRGPADLLMALALIHHLAITNNTPAAANIGLLPRTRPFSDHRIRAEKRFTGPAHALQP